MNPSFPLHRLFRHPVVLLLCLSVLLPAALQAQTTATGIIRGRVFNPSTKDYVRDAEVRVQGTALLTATEDGGHYTLAGVPAGTQTLIVSFSGYPANTVTVNVATGGVTERDLELAPPVEGAAGKDAVQLGAFVVSAALEGNAKAIMNQRNSMSLGTSISADVFGDVTEGNVGEFLKYLPGIEMESVEADTRGPRLGGMDPEYTGVSVDGMKSASADGFGVYSGTENGSAGSSTRSFSFEQVSINSIESIEIHRITPADLDADAPAGTINMKAKRAFDTRGRRLTWSLATGFNSEEMTLNRTAGPGDTFGRKFRPSANLNYSESFLNNRLGVLFGLSESNLYNEQQRVQNAYGSNAAGPVVTSVQLKDGPKWTERRTATFTVDYKATSRLVLSLSAIRSFYEMYAHNRVSTFTFGSNQLAGSDLLTVRTNPGSGQVGNGGGNINKLTHGITVIPKFEYRWNTLTIDGAYSVSASKNTYGTLRRGLAGNAQTNNLTGLTLQASRASIGSSEWDIRQTGGSDWADLANYRNPRVTDDLRYVYNEVTNITGNVKWIAPFAWSTFFKAGFKVQERIVNSDRTGGLSNYSYVGPGGGTTGSYAAFPSPFLFDPSALGVALTSVNGGGGPAYANRNQIGQLFKSNPELFTRNLSADNYYAASFGDRKRLKETIPSVYLVGNTRFRRWQFQGGLRLEKTETESEEFDPLTASRVRAAGYPVNNGTGRATTVDGLDYQYRSNPKVIRRGNYRNMFPSVTAKYRLSEDLMMDFGYGKSIRRPDINNLNGLYSYNEITEEIRASNPNLKPENSDRYAATLAYYLPNAGSLSATFSETQIKNLSTTTEYAAAEFGITDPAFANYTVITTTQGDGTRRFRSMELNYRQRLSFLPAPLRGTTVFATYTRTYASERRRGLTPHIVTGGFDYKYRIFSFGLKGVWQDTAPWSNQTRYRPQVFKMDGDASVELTRRVRLFVQARNILNRDHEILEADGSLWRSENYGSNWVIGLRGSF